MALNPNPLDGSQAINYDFGMGIRNDFTFEPGTCVLPVAEEPPTDPTALAAWSPVVVFQLHAPYRIRRTRYEALKENNPPVMPSPKDVGAFVFLGGTMGLTNSLNSAYVSFNWQAATEYLYVENCVSRPQDGLVLGTPPWTWETSAVNEVVNAGSAILGGAVEAGSVPTGAVAGAGYEVRVAAAMGNTIVFDGASASPLGYFYNMPSFYPGSFFNDYLVNGGVPGGSQ